MSNKWKKKTRGIILPVSCFSHFWALSELLGYFYAWWFVFFLGAWCATNNNDQQYLQIDLGGMRKVTQIASQGRPGSNDYVSSYKISYSQVGSSFEFHRMVIILFISTSVRYKIQNVPFYSKSYV